MCTSNWDELSLGKFFEMSVTHVGRHWYSLLCCAVTKLYRGLPLTQGVTGMLRCFVCWQNTSAQFFSNVYTACYLRIMPIIWSFLEGLWCHTTQGYIVPTTSMLDTILAELQFLNKDAPVTALSWGKTPYVSPVSTECQTSTQRVLGLKFWLITNYVPQKNSTFPSTYASNWQKLSVNLKKGQLLSYPVSEQSQ